MQLSEDYMVILCTKLLPPPRRLCNVPCLYVCCSFVCLSICQQLHIKLLNAFLWKFYHRCRPNCGQ